MKLWALNYYIALNFPLDSRHNIYCHFPHLRPKVVLLVATHNYS